MRGDRSVENIIYTIIIFNRQKSNFLQYLEGAPISDLNLSTCCNKSAAAFFLYKIIKDAATSVNCCIELMN